MAAPFDIWDQAVLTELIVRPSSTQFEDNPRLGDLLAPMRSIQARNAKLQVRQTLAFGKGQFRSPDASPGLYKGNQTWRQETIGLALLEEMDHITEETWLALNSPDEQVKRQAGLDLVERGEILQRRNDRLTEWMRWQCFQGGLTLDYPGGQSLYVDYGFQANQKPTVGTAWSNVATADPISDMRSWANTIAQNSGYYGVRFHMSSDTYDYIVRNTTVRNLLTSTNRSMLIPTKQDVMSLLRDGSDIVIYDNGYRDDSQGSARGVPNSLTRFLPVGKVLVTTEYTIEGQPIAETLDGQVVVGAGYNQVNIVNGGASEMILEPVSKTHLLRVASARIPRLVYPEAFLWATV
jgi:hypothetical protein